MFWLGVLLGLFGGTMLGFVAAGLLGMLARRDHEEFEDQFVREGCRYQGRERDLPGWG